MAKDSQSKAVSFNYKQFKKNMKTIEEWTTSKSKICDSYEQLIDEFFTHFSGQDGCASGLINIIYLAPSNSWTIITSAIFSHYMNKLVSEKSRSKREAVGSEFRVFLSLFSSTAAGTQRLLEEDENTRFSATIKKRKLARKRNMDICEHANWVITRKLKPIRTKKELYQELRDHFGFSLTDRRLRDILKSID